MYTRLALKCAYTRVPDTVFGWLPHLTDAELRTLLVIVRETVGRHRWKAAIPQSTLSKDTGLHRTNVFRAAASLETRGLIRITQIHRKPTVYEFTPRRFSPEFLCCATAT